MTIIRNVRFNSCSDCNIYSCSSRYVTSLIINCVAFNPLYTGPPKMVILQTVKTQMKCMSMNMRTKRSNTIFCWYALIILSYVEDILKTTFAACRLYPRLVILCQLPKTLNNLSFVYFTGNEILHSYNVYITKYICSCTLMSILLLLRRKKC